MPAQVHLQRVSVDGFTVVEVMTAAGVMAMALVGLIQGLVAGGEMLDLSRKQILATQIIHGQIDYVRLQNWTQVGGLTAASAAVETGDSNGFVFGSTLPTLCRGFTCSRTVTTVRSDLKEITFTVSWVGNTGRSYSRSGSTYIARNGLYVTYQRT